MSLVSLVRAGQDDHRHRTVPSGIFEKHEGRGPDRLSAPVFARGLLVAGATALGALWIVPASLVPGHHRGRPGPWALHRASRLLLRALGVGLSQRAGPRSGASLVVADDVSWLDVLVLNAAGPVLPVANAEVARWPLLGSLARRSGTIFIDRKRPSGLPHEVEQIATAMRRGHRVLVFPAAGGRRESAADPFRRAAFQAAVDAAVVVSPVVVTYRGSSGSPVTLGAPVNRATLAASLIRILAHRDTADVNWLSVIPAIVDGGHPAGDRARAAAAAQRAIARALQQEAVDQSTAGTQLAGRLLNRRRNASTKRRQWRRRRGRRDPGQRGEQAGQATLEGLGEAAGLTPLESRACASRCRRERRSAIRT